MTHLSNTHLTAAMADLVSGLPRRDPWPATSWFYSMLKDLNTTVRAAQTGSSISRSQSSLLHILIPLLAGDQPFYVAPTNRATMSATSPGVKVLDYHDWYVGQSYAIFATDEADRDENLEWLTLNGASVPEVGNSLPEGIVIVEPRTNLDPAYTQYSLTPELLEGLPSGARDFAVAILHRSSAENRNSRSYNIDTARWERTTVTHDVQPETLRSRALETWRLILTNRMRSSAVDTSFEEARQAHRTETSQRLGVLSRRQPDAEQHVGTLPFVPHGLSSSLRWGIEVESGGARGVTTPAEWSAVSDGSLRSAYDGYVEVQDFEPYDETVVTIVSPIDCNQGSTHSYVNNRYNRDTESYENFINPNYVNPADCPNCGELSQVVHRVPQTIRHSAQSGDCREFVSPILVSMHSQGLESLTSQLSVRPQNDTSGVHVHVEASHLNDKQLATLVFGYDFLEPLLESSYRRNRRDYCRRPAIENVLAAARFASRGVGSFDARERERYLTLNTQSLGRHGTVEFRAMGPVYDYDYLVRWAMLCRELVNSVTNGATTADFSRVRTWEDLLVFLARFGKEYVRAVTYELTGEAGEAARLEKSGEPVTTEALDADLASLLQPEGGVGGSTGSMAEAVAISTANLRAWGRIVHQQAEMLGSRTGSLVPAGMPVEV